MSFHRYYTLRIFLGAFKRFEDFIKLLTLNSEIWEQLGKIKNEFGRGMKSFLDADLDPFLSFINEEINKGGLAEILTETERMIDDWAPIEVKHTDPMRIKIGFVIYDPGSIRQKKAKETLRPLITEILERTDTREEISKLYKKHNVKFQFVPEIHFITVYCF